MPENAAELWEFVSRLDMAAQVELLAHCASLTLDAVILPKQPGSGAALAHADLLARRLDLDMAATWTPTVASYFDPISCRRGRRAVASELGHIPAFRAAQALLPP